VKTISSNSYLALLPLFDRVCQQFGLPTAGHYELDDTVLRAPPYAADIGEMAAPLWQQINAIDAAAEAARIAAENAPPTKEALKQRIAWRRWEEESGGAQVTLANNDTFTIKTDAESQSKLTGLLVVSSAQPVSVQWKDAAGEFHTLGNADVLVMVSAVFSHVQACFAREAELLVQLESTTDTAAFSTVVEAFWPAAP
jgi:hypothetical protein